MNPIHSSVAGPAPTPVPPPTSPRRPLYHLHKQSFAIALLAAAWLVLINFPAEVKPFSERVGHGWPRYYYLHDGPIDSYWSFGPAGSTPPWPAILNNLNRSALAHNALIALGIVLVAAVLAELWIRRFGRLFRFGLGAVLAGTALIAVLLGLMRAELQHCLHQQSVLGQLASFANVSVEREPRQYDWIRSLFGQHMPGQVTVLHLEVRDSTPPIPPGFGSFPELRDLHLDNVVLSPEWVAQIDRLPLDELQVTASDLHGPRAEVLRSLTAIPILTTLTLSGASFADDDLAAISPPNNLEQLTVRSPKITDRLFGHLVNLPRLKELEFEDADFTGANFAPLLQISHLYMVRFVGCKMSEEDKERLSKLPPNGYLSEDSGSGEKKRTSRLYTKSPEW